MLLSNCPLVLLDMQRQLANADRQRLKDAPKTAVAWTGDDGVKRCTGIVSSLSRTQEYTPQYGAQVVSSFLSWRTRQSTYGDSSSSESDYDSDPDTDWSDAEL